MKKLTIIIAGLLCNFCSSAQLTKHSDHKSESWAFVRQLLQRQSQEHNVAAKTTALKQRLIARSEDASSTASILDSFSVKYSGARGSKFDLEFMDFGQWIGPGFPAFADVLFGYNGNGQPWMKNMGPYILGDTFRIYSMYPVPPYTYGHFADQYHAYDASNNLLDENWVGDATMGGGGERYVLRYNSLSNIMRASYVENSAGVYDTIETAFFIYNSANQMVLDSVCDYNSGTGTYSPNMKYDYTYDASGDMVLAHSWGWTGAWQPNRSYTMTYYAGTHQLKTFAIDTMYTGGLPETLDSFGYTPGHSYSTYSKHVDYTSGLGPQVSVTTRHINTAGLPDSINAYDYGMGTHNLSVYTYNTYNNPVTLAVYDSNGTMPTYLYSVTHYYYELYDATSVANTRTQQMEVQLFPNPVGNTLSLSCTAFMAGTPVVITIANLNGQKLLSSTLQWRQATEQISLAELLPGTYMISIANGTGNAYTKQIIKL